MRAAGRAAHGARSGTCRCGMMGSMKRNGYPAVGILLLWQLTVPARAQDHTLDEAIRLAVAAQYEAALKLFKQELSLHPEDPLRHYLVGMTEFKLANFPNAIGRFQDALEKGAEFPQVYYWLARGYQETGDLPQALSTLEQGLQHFSRNEDLKSLDALLRTDPPEWSERSSKVANPPR